MGYNGWSNWETWHFNMWHMDAIQMDAIEQITELLDPDACKEFICSHWDMVQEFHEDVRDTTWLGDVVSAYEHAVNFYELADHLHIALEEERKN